MNYKISENNLKPICSVRELAEDLLGLSRQHFYNLMKKNVFPMPIYDVATLIQAVALLKSRNVITRTILIGDGPQRAELETLVVRLDLIGDIRFLGYVDHTKLAAWLANSEIFVTPALSDGNNVSLTEAMACGRFPVATDIPANRQWITHGQNGYLYPSGDAVALADMICLAIENKSLRTQARTMNRRIVEERANWQKSRQMMGALFLSVLDQQRRS